MRSILLLTLVLASCATERTGSADRVGSAGSLRITASHYQSMAGVMLKEEDSPTTCKREMITGSHILSWYCNFGDDAIQYQLGRRIVLDSR